MKILLQYGTTYPKIDFFQIITFKKLIPNGQSEVYVIDSRHWVSKTDNKFNSDFKKEKMSLEIIKQNIENHGSIYVEANIEETEITEKILFELFHEHMAEVFL